MKLTLLGTGTSSLKKNKACCAYNISTINTSISVDMGAGVLMNYMHTDIDLFTIDALFLTHVQHPDHVSDLAMFFFSLNYNLLRKRTKVLKIFLHKDEYHFLEKLFKIWPKAYPKHFEIEIIGVDNSELEIGDLKIVTKEVEHGVPTIGLRFEKDDKIISITSDTKKCENLNFLLSKSNLSVLHCAVPVGYIDPRVHLDAITVGELCHQNNVQKAILTHTYPFGTVEEIKQQVARNYQGDVIIGQDLSIYEV